MTELSEFEELIAVDHDEGIKKMQFHRWLTEEILGECWNELYGEVITYSCSKCGKPHKNHTFDNWNDYGDVMEALIAKGMFEDTELLMNPYRVSVNNFFSKLQERWRKEIKK